MSSRILGRFLLIGLGASVFFGCSDSPPGGGTGGNATTSGGASSLGGSNSSGGSNSTGGNAFGGATGGVASGGTPASTSGGAIATGGTGQGGSFATGGASSGGASSGGASSGGASSGGASSGGASSNGGLSASGGTGNAGASSKGGAGGATTGTGGTVTSGGNTTTGGAAATGGATSGGSKFRVFLLLGQSNMAGYAKAQQADKVEEPRIRVLGFDDCSTTGRQLDKWDTAAPPLHECWNGAVGPGDHFAKTLLAALPSGDTIGLVPCAISGEKIETFLKSGGSKYDWIVQRAKAAQQAQGVIEGMIFHQGESNSGDSAWPGKVNQLVTALRSDLGIANAPFIAGELPYSGGAAGHNTQVNKLPGLISNGYVVSASGLVVDPADTQWNLHFDHDSTVTLGKRYAQKMIEALHL